ncbi:MAG TPA: AAA family ATPase [Candidatus Paceibacterota bacterium]
MDVFELAEKNAGLVLEGRASAQMYAPDDFVSPYDEIIRILQQPGACKEDLAKSKVVSAKILQDCHDAVKRLNGLGEFENFDWRTALIKAKRDYDLGRVLKKSGERAERNEEVDWLQLQGMLTSRSVNDSFGLTKAADVDYDHYKPFKKCGHKAIDGILGGLPSDGPIVVYGKTGIGKSHFAAQMADSLLTQYASYTGAIYTCEMSTEHYLWRETHMYPTLKKMLDRLYVSGSVKDIEQLVGEVTTKRVDFVVLDDMDSIVKANEPSEYERVYNQIKQICRFLKIPVFVLCQPNRAAKLSGKFLGPYDVAWSGAAENSAALLIALQKANAMDMDDDTFQTFDEEKWYMIFWKSRDGWNTQEGGQEGPGAIILDKSNQMWRGEPVNKKLKLWTVGSSRRTIGKKKGG